MRKARALTLLLITTACAVPAGHSEDDLPAPAPAPAVQTEEQALLTQAVAELSAQRDDPRVPPLVEALKTRLLVEDTTSEGEDFGVKSEALYAGNGCSSPWWADVLIGAVLKTSTSTFNNQCNWHDKCYSSGWGTYNLSRSSCDSGFRSKALDKCDSDYPWWARLASGAISALYLACATTAEVMYIAVDAKGASHYSGLACIGGQTWPSTSSDGPGCSTYEPFDSSRTRVCSGASGMRADGSVGANWNGCRGSGCLACSDALAAYPRYFANHPLCSRNDTCAGQFYQCGSACPAPTAADR
jgi:hypothetical protein